MKNFTNTIFWMREEVKDCGGRFTFGSKKTWERGSNDPPGEKRKNCAAQSNKKKSSIERNLELKHVARLLTKRFDVQQHKTL